VSEEIHPYVVYRINGDQLECTIWKLQEGEKAVALFLTAEAAAAYGKAAKLGSEWKVFQPGKEALLQLLTACHQAGIRYAVLDPDLTQAKRIFDLGEVLRAAQAPPPPP
jgi:hypothetical protein